MKGFGLILGLTRIAYIWGLKKKYLTRIAHLTVALILLKVTCVMPK